MLPSEAPPHGQGRLGICSFTLRRRSPSEGELTLRGPISGLFCHEGIELGGTPGVLPGERVVPVHLLSNSAFSLEHLCPSRNQG